MNKKYWGQSITNRAVRLVSEFVLKETIINKIEATIKPHNLLSIRCIERAGFVLENELTDYTSNTKADRSKERFLYIKET